MPSGPALKSAHFERSTGGGAPGGHEFLWLAGNSALPARQVSAITGVPALARAPLDDGRGAAIAAATAA
jgi:hypothetical protein